MSFLNKIIAFCNLPYCYKVMTIKRKLSFLYRNSYAKLGNNSVIYNPILVHDKKNIYIGDNTFIRDGARIETITNWKGVALYPKLLIGSSVSIEQFLHLECANYIEICDGVTISSFVFISDNGHSYMDVDTDVLDQELLVNKVIIGKDSFIGTGVKILMGVTIGEHCVIGANSVVNKPIPSYSVACGIPAKIIKRYDSFSKNWVYCGRNN